MDFRTLVTVIQVNKWQEKVSPDNIIHKKNQIEIIKIKNIINYIKNLMDELINKHITRKN